MEYTDINDRDEVIKIVEIIKESPRIKHKDIFYYNIPVSFDIETSSFLEYSEQLENFTNKVGIMYIWMLNINGFIILGRHWSEFYNLLDYICNKLSISLKNRLVIYVHNLGYEFGFIIKHFKWNEIKALKTHKLYNALTDIGIEFRCSLFLSGYNLEKTGENLQYHKSRKAVGQLDYDKLRHSETPLTDYEMEYCLSDVKVVTDFIAEQIEYYGNIGNIPNTKTGRVRRLYRDYIFKNKLTANHYRDLMSQLTFNDVDEYKQCKAAFMGGFTHCNPFYSNRLVDDISLYIDFTSSYPYTMVSENGFPMGKSTFIARPSISEFYKLIENYACIFTLLITNVECIFPNDNYISFSKCKKINLGKNNTLNNGRVVDAKALMITITNIDYEIISRNYKWEDMYILNMYYYPRGYLPKPFIECLLSLYKDKTELKGIEGKEIEYLHSKEDLNSSYGMSVTDIIRDNITVINNEWNKRELTKDEIEKKIREYNEDESRFLFYPWGVFITAFARRNLWYTILNVGDDYVYSDTDSLVLLYPQKHISFIKQYNNQVIKKLIKSSRYYNIPISNYMPKTKDGKIKPLGVWDIENVCLRFKSLGAKRYLYEIPDTKVKQRNKEYKQALESLLSNHPNWFYFESFRISGKHTKLSLTVSGVRKKEGLKYLDRNGHDRAFQDFNEKLIIPAKYSGKSILTYIKEPRSGKVKDYLGNTATYSEECCVHFDKGDYSFSIDGDYLDWIFGLRRLD